MSIIRALASRSLYVMASGVFIGLAAPELAEWAAPALPYAVAAMMTIAAIRISSKDFADTLRRWHVVTSLVAWLLVVSPLLVLGMTWLIQPPAQIAMALIMTAACPPLMSTVGLAWMLGFNPPLALAVVMSATLICPLVLSAVLGAFPMAGISLEPFELFVRLSALVLGSYCLAMVLRRALGPERVAQWSDVWDLATVSALLLFAVAVMDGVWTRASSDPGYVLLLLVVAFGSNLIHQVAGFWVSRRLGRSSAMTMAFASGARAVGILLAVAPGGAESDLVLFFALYQFPMYTLPVVLRRIYSGPAASDSPVRT